MAGVGSGAVMTALVGNDEWTPILPAFILLRVKNPLCAGLRSAAGRRTSSTGRAGRKMNGNTDIAQRL